ncbi:hypothetical protein ACOMHN_006915 [Nucella lapillus]
MDKEVAETLAYFSQNAFELRQLGKEWGLNEEEIEECIERAMSIDAKDLPAPEKNLASTTKLKFAARRTWPKLRILLWIIGGFIVMVGLGALAMQNEQIDHRVSQIMQPFVYPFFRYLRLTTVSLHDTIDMYDSFHEECVVSNPLFSRQTLLGDHACENCNTVTNIRQFTITANSSESESDIKPLPGTVLLEPVLFKGRGNSVSLDVFRKVLSQNQFAQQPMMGVSTNLDWAPHVKDLLEEDVPQKLAAKPDFYFFWKSKLVWTSQIMRKVFPKPAMLGNMEVAIRKSIYLTGPQADGLELPDSPTGTHSWYVQGSGTRKMVLNPVPFCQGECTPLSVVLHAGDMVTYNCDIYTAKIIRHGEDISISFLGHFTLDE